MRLVSALLVGSLLAEQGGGQETESLMRKFFLIGFAIFLIQSVFAQNEVAFSLRGGFYEESFTNPDYAEENIYSL